MHVHDTSVNVSPLSKCLTRRFVGSVSLFLVLCIQGGVIVACLFSSFLLFRTRLVKYLMAFWCMSFMSFLIFGFGILRSFSLLMECSCMAPLTPAVIVIRGFVFQPVLCMWLISGSYLFRVLM